MIRIGEADAAKLNPIPCTILKKDTQTATGQNGFWHPFCPVAVWVSFFRMVQGIGFSFAASASPILITGYSKGQLSGKISNYGMITTFATLIGNPLALRI